MRALVIEFLLAGISRHPLAIAHWRLVTVTCIYTIAPFTIASFLCVLLVMHAPRLILVN
jgi:hypothetical protein